MSEPQFENCWIDKDAPLLTVQVGGTEFRLRPITAGEHQQVTAAAKFRDSKDYDLMVAIIGEVTAMLGGYTKIGNEGWSNPRPVTEDNVRGLRSDVIFTVYIKATEFFPRPGGSAESGAGGPLGK